MREHHRDTVGPGRPGHPAGGDNVVMYGDSTRTLNATSSPALPGQPVAPSPVLAATYHLSTDDTAGLDSYGRSANTTWRQLESALAELESATSALVFSSGMAAISAGLAALTRPGSVLVVPADGYYQVRRYAAESGKLVNREADLRIARALASES